MAIIILSGLINEIFLGGFESKKIMLYWLKAALYGSGNSYSTPFIINNIGGIWFLLSTFFATIILRWLLDKNKIFRLFIVLLIFILSYYSTKIAWFPFSIQAAGFALLYMYIGTLFKQEQEKLNKLSSETKYFCLIIAIIIWINFILNFQGFYIVCGNFGRGIIDIISSICASGIIIIISKLVEKYFKILPKILILCGKYSLIILCVHIIELDLFPYYLITNRLNQIGVSNLVITFIIIVIKFIWIFASSYLIIKINFLKKLFGYNIKKD